jgi:hypothetical protein
MIIDETHKFLSDVRYSVIKELSIAIPYKLLLFGIEPQKKDKDMIEYYGEFLKEYATATQLIYEVNASNTLLKKKDVENMKKGDLLAYADDLFVADTPQQSSKK